MKSNSQRRRGATAVEVAICLPVLIMFLFASYELARANMLLHAAESAAYEGARVGIVPGADKKKIEEAAGFVLRSIGASKFDVKVSPGKINADTKRILVEVEVPLKDNSTIMKLFLKDPVFRGKCELTREVL